MKAILIKWTEELDKSKKNHNFKEQWEKHRKRVKKRWTERKNEFGEKQQNTRKERQETRNMEMMWNKKQETWIGR